MHIEISLKDGLPIYRQIVKQVKYLIASGQLQSGAELPAIRTLAEQTMVTPNTIVKAYSQLEAEGLVFKRQGAGTYVAEVKSPLARAEQKRILSERVDGLLVEARQLNFRLEEVIDLLHRRQKTLDKSLPREDM